ncbi:MAG: hypothetical protein M1828_006298 [Chrysothrix sp. TS-e1954]|nr:MAG: hypothetical protein M1828_006298 [Chrysothrix sp. TS-e1954]
MYFSPAMYNSYERWCEGILSENNEVPAHVRTCIENEVTLEDPEDSNANDQNPVLQEAHFWYRHHCDKQRDLISGSVELDSLRTSLSRLRNLERVTFDSYLPRSPRDKVMLETFVQRSASCGKMRHAKQAVRTARSIRNCCNTRKPLTLILSNFNVEGLARTDLTSEILRSGEASGGALTTLHIQLLCNHDYGVISDGVGLLAPYTRGRDVLLSCLETVERFQLQAPPVNLAPASTLNRPEVVFLHNTLWGNLNVLCLEDICLSQADIFTFFEESVPALKRLTLKDIAFEYIARENRGASLTWLDLFHHFHDKLTLTAVSLDGEFISINEGVQTIWKATKEKGVYATRDEIELFICHKVPTPFHRVRQNARSIWESPLDGTWSLAQPGGWFRATGRNTGVDDPCDDTGRFNGDQLQE